MDLPKPSEWIDSMFQCYVFRDPSKLNPLSGINMLVCHNWFQNSKRMRFVSDGTIMDYQSHFTATMLYQLHNKYYITKNPYNTLELYTNGFELIGAIFMPVDCVYNVKWKPLSSIAPGIVANNARLANCKIFEMKPIWFGHDPVPYTQTSEDIQKLYKPIFDRARGFMLTMKLQDMRKDPTT